MYNLQSNIDFKQLLDIVRQLSPEKKIELNEFIWDDKFEIPIEHKRLVLDRIEKSRLNPSRMLDWDIVSKTLNS